MKQQPVYTFSLWVFFGAIAMIGLGIFRFVNHDEKFVEPANIAELVLGVCLFVTAAIYRSRYPEDDKTEDAEDLKSEEPIQEPVVVSKPEINNNASTVESNHNEIAVLLRSLQEKGRFIDFVMDDVTKYNDAQVGAAARVVHAGCKSVMSDYLKITSISTESEQSTVTLEEGYNTHEFKIIGNVKGNAPFVGKLIHKGWKVEKVNLPELLQAKSIPSGKEFTVAQAEIQVN